MAKRLNKKEYAKQKQAEMKETINEAMDAVTNHTKNPSDFIEYLDFMSKMYDYSPRNQMLLNSQYDGADGVAGKKQFKEMGFNVHENEKPLNVLAPVFKKYTVDDNKKWIPLDRPNKEQQAKIDSGEYNVKRKLAYYKFAEVYDIGQTDAKAEDYPKMFPNRPFQFDESSMNEKYPKLKQAIQSFSEKEGYQLHDEADTNRLGKAKGMYVPATHSIYIRPHLSNGEYLSTLNHEIAHEQLHKSSQLDRPTKELEAEMTAYVTNKHFDLDTSDKAIEYMAQWTNNLNSLEDKDKIKVIERVSKASRNMINGIEKEYEQEFEIDKNKASEIINEVKIKDEKIQDFTVLNDVDSLDVTFNNKKMMNIFQNSDEKKAENIKVVKMGDMTFDYSKLKDERLKDFLMLDATVSLDAQFKNDERLNIYNDVEEKNEFNQYEYNNGHDSKTKDVTLLDMSVGDYMEFAVEKKNGVSHSKNIDQHIDKQLQSENEVPKKKFNKKNNIEL